MPGSCAIAWADSVGTVAGDVAALLAAAPWCVPCLIATAATADPDVLSAIHGLRGQLCFVTGPVPPPELPGRVLAAVRGRHPPGAGYLADYVVRRTQRPEVRPELLTLLARPADPESAATPDRTVRDRLRRFGPLTAHCWRAVGVLARAAAAMRDEPVDHLAGRAGIGPRTLRAWVRRYLATDLRAFRRRVGWEWVMETALRVAGYVETPGTAAPPALSRPVFRPLLPVAQGVTAPSRFRVREATATAVADLV